MNRAEQSLHLADEIEQDVVATMEAMLRQHSEVSKRVFTDGQRLTKHWQEAYQSFEQLSSDHTKACSEAEEGARQCISGASSRPGDWKKLADRSVALSRHATDVEREYNKAIQRLNTMTQIHERQMGHVLSALQDMEEKRARCFHDTAMKMAVYDTSWLRNVQYDLDSAVKAVEEVDNSADLQEFIKKHHTQAPSPSQFHGQPNWELSHIAEKGLVKRDNEAIVVNKVKVIRPLLQAILSSEVSGVANLGNDQEALIELCRNLQGVDHVEDVVDAVGSDGCEGSRVAATCRTAFCLALREEIQTRIFSDPNQSPAAEDLPSLHVGSTTFTAIVSLFKAALDGCDRENDAWNGRDLLVLSKSIQSTCSEGIEKDVLLQVYTHPLWSRVTFWEGALLVGIAEAHSQSTSLRSSTAGIFEPHKAMTTFLRRYVDYMVALGIKREQAHGCVQRTLAKHTQLLGPMAEAYAKMLTHSGTYSGDDNNAVISAIPSAEAGTTA